MSTTQALQLLFDPNDKLVGEPFIKFLSANLKSNKNLVEKEVIKSGRVHLRLLLMFAPRNGDIFLLVRIPARCRT